MSKKNGGSISEWQLHTITNDVELIRSECPGVLLDKGMVFTGTVVDDPTGRWEKGFHMRSSLIVDMDLIAGTIETSNTLYTIIGLEGDPVTDNKDIGLSVLQIVY